MNGNGTLFYPDGKRFEGQWRDGNKHGKGLMCYPDGSIVQIVYQEGRR
jgi:antitoxin component YwqK of YwqJK toxin-antitoxin module